MARVAGTLRRAGVPMLVLAAVAVTGGVALGSYLVPLACWLVYCVCLAAGVLWMAWAAAAPHR